MFMIDLTMQSQLFNKKFIRSVAVLTGTMVGVGVFGIPFAFSKSGFWVGLSFLVLVALINLIVDLLYGELILRTSESHQLVGYIDLYLGAKAKKVIFFSIILSTYAALLAYVIIAGEFLTNVFSNLFRFSISDFSIGFFIFASLLILLGIKTISWIEVGLGFLFITIIFTILGFGFNEINFQNFNYINLESWFLPYGVLLFAFAGLPAIPIQRRILKGQEKDIKKSIFIAVSIVSVLYFIFAFTVFGISGEVTSPEAINGLVPFLGEKIIWLGSLFGALAVTTSFIMLGSSLLEIFKLDYKFSNFVSWVFVILPPLVLFIGGLRNFIDIIGLAGSVAIGIEMVMLVYSYIKSKTDGDRDPEFEIKIPHFFLFFIMAIFVCGAIYSLIYR